MEKINLATQVDKKRKIRDESNTIKITKWQELPHTFY
jgi:hypothetical protein